MSVKNITGADLVLLDLLNAGRTDASPAMLEDLESRGRIVITASGKPKLTDRGRRRAERLQDAEADLRLAFSGTTANGDGGIRTVAGNGLHIGGGRPASIRS